MVVSVWRLVNTFCWCVVFCLCVVSSWAWRFTRAHFTASLLHHCWCGVASLFR